MTTFLPRDRALCRNAHSSSLWRGRLYYVVHCAMTPDGRQSLYLIGEPVPWNADRFERVPDPHPRKWPAQ